MHEDELSWSAYEAEYAENSSLIIALPDYLAAAEANLIASYRK